MWHLFPMKRRCVRAALGCVLAATCATALSAEDGPVVGIVEWEPGLERDATLYDKTDYWAGIAYSPATGKYGSSGAWTSRENAARVARENCNADDARVVVLCCNGWCALALGTEKDGWGVGWGPTQDVAERYALQGARERVRGAKVVYSIDARAMLYQGVIAYSTRSGAWGYSYGYGRSDVARARAACGDEEAEIMVSPQAGSWMALALGGDVSAYGWGYAGNRIDAENHALKECRKHSGKARIAVSFCTSGVAH